MISKYIVPIYNDADFQGTGFIVNNYFITAAHVVKDLSHPIFIFEGNKIRLQPDSKILLTYDKNKEEREDLAIFKVKILSSLSLSSENVSSKICCYQGYSYVEEKKQLTENIYNNIMILHEHAYSVASFHTEPIKYRNCITCTPSCCEGNSGGPLFQDEKIVGMYFSSYKLPPSYRSVEDYYIKGSYINNILNKI